MEEEPWPQFLVLLGRQDGYGNADVLWLNIRVRLAEATIKAGRHDYRGDIAATMPPYPS